MSEIHTDFLKSAANELRPHPKYALLQRFFLKLFVPHIQTLNAYLI